MRQVVLIVCLVAYPVVASIPGCDNATWGFLSSSSNLTCTASGTETTYHAGAFPGSFAAGTSCRGVMDNARCTEALCEDTNGNFAWSPTAPDCALMCADSPFKPSKIEMTCDPRKTGATGCSKDNLHPDVNNTVLYNNGKGLFKNPNCSNYNSGNPAADGTKCSLGDKMWACDPVECKNGRWQNTNTGGDIWGCKQVGGDPQPPPPPPPPAQAKPIRLQGLGVVVHQMENINLGGLTASPTRPAPHIHE